MEEILHDTKYHNPYQSNGVGALGGAAFPVSTVWDCPELGVFFERVVWGLIALFQVKGVCLTYRGMYRCGYIGFMFSRKRGGRVC